jgi:hypothetical protein
MTRSQRFGDIMTPAVIAAMPAGPDKAEVMAFHRFLLHHAPAHPCSCGVAARRDEDGDIVAVANPDCDCPCHEPGYATSAKRA